MFGEDLATGPSCRSPPVLLLKDWFIWLERVLQRAHRHVCRHTLPASGYALHRPPQPGQGQIAVRSQGHVLDVPRGWRAQTLGSLGTTLLEMLATARVEVEQLGLWLTHLVWNAHTACGGLTHCTTMLVQSCVVSLVVFLQVRTFFCTLNF